MMIRTQIRQLFMSMGFEISRINSTSHPLARRKLLLQSLNIGLVIDVGANIGQFAEFLRKQIGYSKEIISFEPLSSEYKILRAKTVNDKRWKAINCAIGNVVGKSEINIAANSYSSSMLEMLNLHETAAPHSKYVDNELVDVTTIDNIMSDLSIEEKNIYLKIDTQGFERKVLEGAESSLKRISTIQLEMSLKPLYKGEVLFNELNDFLCAKGYQLIGVEPGFSDPKTGHILQVDGIYHRPKEVDQKN